MKAAAEQQKTINHEKAQNTFSGLGNPFKLVFEQSQHMQCIISLDGRILAANQQAKKLSSPANTLKLVGQRIWNAPWWRTENAVLIKALFKTAVDGQRSQQKLELQTPSHMNLRYAFSFSPVSNVLGQVTAVLIEGHAIKAKQLSIEENLDNLTGFANQALLNDYLKGITKRSKNNPGYLFAVLSLKLEGLRNIKNQYGETR